MNGLSGVSLNNKVIMTGMKNICNDLLVISILPLGGYKGDNIDVNSVLSFNKDTKTWEEIGQLKTAIAYHAVSIVTLGEIEDFCIEQTNFSLHNGDILLLY